MVAPAFDEVAGELRGQGVVVEVVRAADEGEQPGIEQPGIELVTDVGADLPFVYRVQRREQPIPAYGGWAPRGNERYTRLEVHLHSGGQGYDVMGYSRTQLIDDVLDQYERHLEFLRIHDASQT